MLNKEYDYARDGLEMRGLWTHIACFAAQTAAAK